VGTRATASEKVERDALVAADRARGLTWATIGERHGLSDRQCRAIVKERRASQPLLRDHDAEDAVREALEQLDALIEKFALLADRASHSGVKLGALKAQATTLGARFTLMQQVGLLPHNLRAVSRDAEMRETLQVVMETVERNDPDGIMLDELLVALEPIRQTWKPVYAGTPASA
jgi:hypothetical protein